MARTRKDPEDNHLSKRVYKGRSAYEFKHPGGRTIRLCSLNSDKSVIWSHYEKLINEDKCTETYASLVDEFFKSIDFMDLSGETQKDYTKYSRKVLPVFGKMKPDNIKPEHVRKYMDKRGLNSHT